MEPLNRVNGHVASDGSSRERDALLAVITPEGLQERPDSVPVLDKAEASKDTLLVTRARVRDLVFLLPPASRRRLSCRR